MTTIPHEPPIPAGEPYRPADIPAVAARTGRSALAAVLVFVGGYLTITTLSGQLAGALTGFLSSTGPFVTLLLFAQFVFAILVVLVGLIAAVGSGTGKLIGALLVVVGLGLALVVAVLRLSGALRIGVESSFTISNPWFTTVLLVGVAWLLVRRARLGWLSLLGLVVLAPVPHVLQLAGIESALIQLVMLFLSAMVGAGILLAGRPWRD